MTGVFFSGPPPSADRLERRPRSNFGNPENSFGRPPTHLRLEFDSHRNTSASTNRTLSYAKSLMPSVPPSPAVDVVTKVPSQAMDSKSMLKSVRAVIVRIGRWYGSGTSLGKRGFGAALGNPTSVYVINVLIAGTRLAAVAQAESVSRVVKIFPVWSDGGLSKSPHFQNRSMVV
eukprot:CAMPEP_0198328614 /NCGR_PEP_ID=MMETSP1450-20131203/15585_1 /TAXON_ID=753684 ORGANISM="Madagascaria erythrocladiodes, Strain CCMP3234" /NCGR_SAMPLE_ID=MMETSP1450 /ASSEMBLY_ACC=CAM_ASM_001115 /LENGTH=173 /DNA_ID=CAMNT_0044032761 /DNA_START=321 /DNA_END=844 /DNA_ORIENTATION=+